MMWKREGNDYSVRYKSLQINAESAAEAATKLEEAVNLLGSVQLELERLER